MDGSSSHPHFSTLHQSPIAHIKRDRIYFIHPLALPLHPPFQPLLYLLYFSSTPPFKVAAWKKKKKLFVSPLDSSPGAKKVSLSEMNPCVSYENILGSLRGNTHGSQAQCFLTLNNKIYEILKSKKNNIIFWHLTNWIIGK